MNYAIYPFEYMRITQAHNEGNHVPHWNPFIDYADKPWDEACKDSGRNYFIAQNDYIIDEVIIGNRSLRLSTASEVKIPYQEQPVILHITLTHMKEEDMRKLKAGQFIPKGTKLILEGDEGGASGYHFHCTANIGKYYGLKKNANDKYCFTYDKSLLPNEAFYVDPNFTTILDSKCYSFKTAQSFLPPRGYFTKGDSGDKIELIDDFFASKVAGNYFGDYTVANVKEFQRQNGLEQDGNIGPITLEKMREQGFKY